MLVYIIRGVRLLNAMKTAIQYCFTASQGSAELHGVAFCHEYGDEPQQTLQGNQERIPQGMPSRPWHDPSPQINMGSNQHSILQSDINIRLSKNNLLKTHMAISRNNETEWGEVNTSVAECLTVFCVSCGGCFRDHPQKLYYSQTALPSGIMHPITDMDSS